MRVSASAQGGVGQDTPSIYFLFLFFFASIRVHTPLVTRDFLPPNTSKKEK